MSPAPLSAPSGFGRFALPSGSLEVSVALSPADGPTILTAESAATCAYDSNGSHTFSCPAAIVQLHGRSFRPYMPSLLEPLISGCFGIVLTVVPHTPLSGVLATCRRVGPDSDLEWTGPESGEYLDAMSWIDGKHCYCLGTGDGELLSVFAREGIALPRRHGNRYDLGTVRYLPDGLQVPLAELLPGEPCSIHFACAWSDRTSPDGAVAVWYAVDTCPSLILGTDA